MRACRLACLSPIPRWGAIYFWQGFVPKSRLSAIDNIAALLQMSEVAGSRALFEPILANIAELRWREPNPC